MAQKLKIAFAGDVNFSGIFRQQLLEGKEIFAPEVLQQLREQDFVVINLEGPATNSPSQKSSGVALHSPPEAIPYLIARNIKVFNLANNHLFDHGAAGFEETIALIEKHGGQWFGAGKNLEQALKPIELAANGISRGMMGIAHNEGMIASNSHAGVLCEVNQKEISQAIKDFQKTGKQLIINYHGGEEYTRYPSPARRKRLKSLALNAQSWVVAHHSHTLQGVESVKGNQVFYSLGNFVFDLKLQANRSHINQSAILFAEFDQAGGSYNWLPININTAKGIIETRQQEAFANEIEALNNWAEYGKHWLAEAHRVFWMTRSGGEVANSDSSKGVSMGSPSILKKLFKPSAWKAIWQMYRNPHTRPIAVGALTHTLKQKLGK
jgi:poly-gamma-glutamate synthesis protein (capsule biosynthesis protein)